MRNSKLGAAAFMALVSAQAGAQQKPESPDLIDRTVLPITPPAFKGYVALRAKESRPDFPAAVSAPAGAPNVLLIMLDDVGFGASSTFGGPCQTPTLQRLAETGLRYNRFHTTAVSSPTRAALLTGRNHHSAHSGVVTEMATGYPGYDSVLGKDMATIGEILKQNGYNTAWFGKDHNVSDWESSAAGPYDRWPVGQGFEKFYGFVGGETNQWRPAVFDGTTPIEPYIGNPNYHFDDDMADQAIKWIDMQKTVAPDKPFLAYYAPGATHSPHQPRPEWAAKYKGKFDQGWDKVREETFARQKKMGIIPADAKLTPRPSSMPSWDSSTPEQRKLWAYMMELAAGYLEQTDYNIGRVLKAIEDQGQLDNTLVIYVVGDNGAAADGSLNGTFNGLTLLSSKRESMDYLIKRQADMGTWKSNNIHPTQWGWAMNAPFQWTKQFASHFGGTRNGLVISWPKGIKAKGELRTQFHHVIDIVPTILEAARLPQPVMVNGVAQKPIEGVSMAYTFADAKAPGRRKTQYFEMFGNSAIYHDGWLAATTPGSLPWIAAGVDIDVLTTKWELYNLDKDFSEADDLAAKMPEKLREMQVRFYAEAAKYNALPIDSSRVERFSSLDRPNLTRDRTTFVYHGGLKRIPEGAAPEVKNRNWTLTAEIDAKGKDNGVIATQGGLVGGWGLYFDNGKPVFSYMFADGSSYRIPSGKTVPAGKHTVVMNFTYDGGGMGKGGTVEVLVDKVSFAKGRVEQTAPLRFTIDETLDFGEDTGTPVDLTYDVPAKFTGEVGKVTIELK